MKLTFDGTQAYQLAAVDAVVDLFDGQPVAQGAFEAARVAEGVLFTENNVAGNSLVLSPEQILENLQGIQRREENHVPAALWDRDLKSLDFSVEMETGTGKTYVYLRTIHELHQRYGWRKFIIVVPSVAIRAGVKQSLDAMREHYREVFDRQTIDDWVYDSKDVNLIRSFARDNDLKVMVMTTGAFNRAGNVLYQEREGLGQGIDFVADTRPIVILDEPQKMEGPSTKEGLRRLNPLFTLRYSATHADVHHQVYNLDPVRAYDMGLVKKIHVRSVLQQTDPGQAHVVVKKIRPLKAGPKATLEILRLAKGEVKPVSVTINQGEVSLEELSGGLEQYRDLRVEEVRQDAVVLSSGRELGQGQAQGPDRDAIMGAQVRETVQRHLDQENYLRRHITDPAQRMKVLSVIFIDKVANYVPFGDGEAKIRRWFEDAYRQLSAQERYRELGLPPVEDVHDGYFSVDKKGTAKDTRGDTADDASSYQRIMANKTVLLDLENPLRFVFSHSALREGWDNPNVFQICTLNESRSADRKRQEIGRGLRLPVMADGQRCRDPQFNVLTVIANEHYEDFARSLQAEIEEETGVDFGRKRIVNDRDTVAVSMRVEPTHPELLTLLRAIAPATHYEVNLDSGRLVDEVVERLRELPAVDAPKITVQQAALSMESGTEEQAGGVRARATSGVRQSDTEPIRVRIPDVLGYLQNETKLTRRTLARIVKASGRLDELPRNPMAVLGLFARTINQVKAEHMATSTTYHVDAEHFEDKLEELVQQVVQQGGARIPADSALAVDGAVHSHIRYDSEVERQFAEDLDGRTGIEDTDGDVPLYLKLPPGYRIPTPVGRYNPDWGILKIERVDGREVRVSVVAETKSTEEVHRLRPVEHQKFLCGRAHFQALGVQFKAPVTTADAI